MTKLALLLGEGALAHAAYQAAQKHFGAGHVVGMALEPLVWPELPHFDLDDLPQRDHPSTCTLAHPCLRCRPR